jgi:hypothetical protein
MRPLADAGDPLAMFNLAVLISRRTAWNEARDWYRRAADAGHTAAMVNLAIMLRESGDDVEAAQWYRRAADHGHITAMIFPEHPRPDSARTILGSGPFTISVRRRTERGPFRVLSSPLHRPAARRIAGLSSPIADEVADRLSEPATGCLLVYAVAESAPAGAIGGPVDDKATTLAFHMVTPMSTAPADGELGAWGVRSSGDPSAVTTDGV